jgi:hypothetical protein
VGDAFVSRFSTVGCWDYLEDLLKLENIFSPVQAALAKKVRLIQVFKRPALYKWLLNVPRRNSCFQPTPPFSKMHEVLDDIVYYQRFPGDAVRDDVSLSPPAPRPAPAILDINGSRYVLDTSSAADAPAFGGTTTTLSASTNMGSRLLRMSLSNHHVHLDTNLSTNATGRRPSRKKSFKSESSGSHLVGPRTKPEKASK